MDILNTGDPRIIGIVGHKPKENKYYRLSNHTFSLSVGKAHLIRNTLTRAIASFSDTEWTLLESAKKHLFSGRHLLDVGFGKLVQSGFFIEVDAEECKQYALALSVLRTMSREKKGTKTYTILPTTGCNARCVYCYEEGMTVRTMTNETADQVAEFIDRTCWQDGIKMIWFGGEPLAASSIISRICGRLKERGIPFRSRIVTNGTLLTLELSEEAVTLWNLESAQVSVDGIQEDYETRKRYVIPSMHHYDAMMRAVNLMLDRGIRVTLRCNYDGENFARLKEFFDDVKARFGNADKLSVYPAMLFQTKENEKCVDLFREAQSLYAYIRELGLNRTETEKKDYILKTNHCEADSGDKSVIIDPDGLLYHCEHLPGNTSFGSIFDPSVTVCSDDRAAQAIHETCKTCPFLPECTPFFRNGCPDWFAYCREFKQIEAEESLHRLMMSTNLVAHSGSGGTD